METRVFEKLKPKAASFGFNDDELKIAAKYIAGSLQAEATDEMIDTAIDQFAPILGLSQNASQRFFSKMKTQFEKDHPTPTAPQPAPPAPPTPPAPPAPTQSPNDVPEWFKQYQQQKDQETAELKAKLEQMTKDKANEGFSARALAGLKDVDENYYGLMLKGRQFNSDEEVDAFVGEVKEGWNKLVQAKGIQVQAQVAPPGGGAPAPTQPSQSVLDRIADREKIQESSPIRGIAK